MMERVLALFSAVMAIGFASQSHADGYDGKWQVRTEAKACRGYGPRAAMTPAGVLFVASVTGTSITGTAQGLGVSLQSSADFSGTISPDGTFTVRARAAVISGQFSGEKLDIKVVSEGLCPERLGSGGRAQ
jgi:hypothetical protein